MKKLLIALFILSAMACQAQTVSTANEMAPLPVANSPITGFFTAAQVATAGSFTITIPASSTTAYPLGTLPSGAKGVMVSTDVAINFGNASCTTGTNWPTIAAEGTKEFIVTPLDKTVSMYFSQRATGATATVRILPYK